MHEKFGCIVTVHLDPLVMNDPVVNELKGLTMAAAKAVDPNFTVHDFRMTKGETQINLIFDLVLPADCVLSPNDAAKAVEKNVREVQPNCFCVIKTEYPFV